MKLEFEGLKDAAMFFQHLPEVSAQAASIAINQVVQRGGMRLIQDTMYEQIAFPKGYLTGDRLTITQFAKPDRLQATIVGRQRATSLARFAQGQPIGGGQFAKGGARAPNAGVRVTLKNGGKVMRGAWLVKLNAGKTRTSDNYNVGLAVRVKPGETVKGKHYEHRSWLVKPTDKTSGVALLYGPSVDQVFRDVAGDVGEPLLKMVEVEFNRQFDRLVNK